MTANCNYVKRGMLCYRTLPAQPHLPLPKRNAESHPTAKAGGFTRRFDNCFQSSTKKWCLT
jgi:hypothetical protein